MINNLDHKSQKTRENLQEHVLTINDVKRILEQDPKHIFWLYNPKTNKYSKLTATIESDKAIFIDQNKNVIEEMDKDSKSENVVFEEKKIMLSYQRAPEKKQKTKKDLLRNALGQKELLELLKEGRTNVWAFNEMDQTYAKYKIVKEGDNVVLKNKENQTEKFVDAIFKSEYEIKQYSETSFM